MLRSVPPASHLRFGLPTPRRRSGSHASFILVPDVPGRQVGARSGSDSVSWSVRVCGGWWKMLRGRGLGVVRGPRGDERQFRGAVFGPAAASAGGRPQGATMRPHQGEHGVGGAATPSTGRGEAVRTTAPGNRSMCGRARGPGRSGSVARVAVASGCGAKSIGAT